MNRKVRIIVLITLIVSVFTLGIAYATVSRTLNLNADIEFAPSPLNVNFVGVSTSSSAYDGATIVSEGTINGTSINNMQIRLIPGSSIRTTIQVLNSSENATVKLDDIDFFIQDASFSLVHNNQEILLQDYYNDYSENLTSEIIEDLLGTDEYDEEDVYDFLSDIMYELTNGVTLTIYKDDNGISREIIELSFGSGGILDDTYLSELADVSAQNINTRMENYVFVGSLSEDANISLPDGYSLKVSSLNLKFNYVQVIGS